MQPAFVTRSREAAIFERFLADPKIHWCVIHGRLRTGKSAFLESVALDAKLRRAVVATEQRPSTWHIVAESITAQLDYQHDGVNWRRLLVTPWSYLPPELDGLLVAIELNDDEAAFATALHLGELEQALRERPFAKVKVVLSCSSATWEKLRSRPPFSVAVGIENLRLDTVEIPLGRFDSDDLEAALARLNWRELSEGRFVHGVTNPTHASVYEMIHEPLMWGAYSSLRASGDWEEGLSTDWGALVVRMGHQFIEKIRILRELSEGEIKYQLAQVARLSMELCNAKYSVDRETLGDRVVQIAVNDTNVARSTYRAAVDTGLLIENEVRPVNATFAREELGSYFLSFSFEHELSPLDAAERRTRVVAWLDQIDRWRWVLEGMLLLVAREEIDEEIKVMVLDVICDNWSLNHAVVFALAPSQVIPYLLRTIGTGTTRSVSASEGIDTVPISPQSLATVRNALLGADAAERLNAVHIVGARQVESLAPDLLDLLYQPALRTREDGDGTS